eukprot:gene16034-biopygen737
MYSNRSPHGGGWGAPPRAQPLSVRSASPAASRSGGGAAAGGVARRIDGWRRRLRWPFPRAGPAGGALIPPPLPTFRELPAALPHHPYAAQGPLAGPEGSSAAPLAAAKVLFSTGTVGGKVGGKVAAWRQSVMAAKWRQSFGMAAKWRHGGRPVQTNSVSVPIHCCQQSSTSSVSPWRQSWRQSWRHSGKALAAKQGRVAAKRGGVAAKRGAMAARRQSVAAWRQSVAAWRLSVAARRQSGRRDCLWRQSRAAWRHGGKDASWRQRQLWSK